MTAKEKILDWFLKNPNEITDNTELGKRLNVPYQTACYVTALLRADRILEHVGIKGQSTTAKKMRLIMEYKIERCLNTVATLKEEYDRLESLQVEIARKIKRIRDEMIENGCDFERKIIEESSKSAKTTEEILEILGE